MRHRLRASAVITAVLTGCVIIIGILFMPDVLPDYKDGVTTFPKSQQNRMLYVEQSDELVLYPWDTFEPDDCEKFSLDISKKFFATEWFSRWVYEVNPPIDPGRFTPTVYYDLTQDMYYVRNYEYMNKNSETCVISFAYHKDRPVYLDCHLKSERQTVTDIGKLSEQLNRMVRESAYTASGDIDGIEVANEATEYDDDNQNPIDRYLSSVLNRSDPGYAYKSVEQIIIAIQNAKQTTAISNNNQILLVLSGEGTVVLFYDPEHDEINGFSIKP